MPKTRTKHAHSHRQRAAVRLGRDGLTVEAEFTPAGLLAIGGAVSAMLLSSAVIVAVARLPLRRAAVRLGRPTPRLPGT